MSDSLPSTDPAHNSRFTPNGDGTYSETMAPMVTLFYDVNTMAARCHFHCQPFVTVASKYIPNGDAPMDTLEVDFSQNMTACYGTGLVDPVTGADLGLFSVAGFMLTIKQAFDIKHNARAAAIAAANALAAQKAALAAVVTILNKAVPTPSEDGTTAAFSTAISDQTVTFTDTSSAGELLSLTGWSWSFGDGLGSSTEQNPTYTYPTPGDYQVTLGVTDSSGVVVSVVQTVTVTAPAAG